MAKGNPWDDEWEIESSLGKGRQGTTHLVSHRRDSQKKGALKKLINNKNQQQRSRMHNEVSTLRSLAPLEAKVPRVVADNIAEFADPSVQLFFVMEHIPGETLDEVVKKGPIAIKLAIEFIEDLAATLKAAHSIDILHRDLKPDNIVVRECSPPDLVIVDYGLSFNKDLEDTLTQTGEPVGNTFYRLPEQYNFRDERSDIAGLVAIFYYCLTGTIPGQPRDENGKAPHRRDGGSVRQFVGEASWVARLETCFDRGFQPKIDDRFQTIDEFLERLRAVVDGSEVEAGDPPSEVASKWSVVLLRENRKTRLANVEPHAARMMKFVKDHASSYTDKLGCFKVAQMERNLDLGAVLYEDVDRCQRGVRIQINVEHENSIRAVEYAVGHKGNECGLFFKLGYRFGDNAASGGNVEFDKDWKNVIWYSDDRDPNEGEIRVATDHLDETLKLMIEELGREITQGDE